MVRISGKSSPGMGVGTRGPEAQGLARRDGQGSGSPQGQGGREEGEVQDQPVQPRRLRDALAQPEPAGRQTERVSRINTFAS